MLDFSIAAVLTFIGLFMTLNTSALLLWVERKGSALVQNRIGANRANIFGGLLPFNVGLINTLVADLMKFVCKEDFTPPGADKLLHTLSPFVALLPLLIIFVVIPFGDVLIIGERTISLQAANLNVGLLYVLAMVSLCVYGVVLGGWASNNKYAFLGALRASAQMVSYEVALGLSIIAVLMLAGNVTLPEMVAHQQLGVWYVFPLSLAFLLFVISAFAETNRLPFDMAEAESELVTGYHTEYSAMKFSAFMIAEFGHMVTASALMATLFFGSMTFQPSAITWS